MSYRRFRAKQTTLLIAIACVVIAGCGGNTGPRRVAVTGSIEVDGKAIENGVVRFLPGEGNKGPAANVTISRGYYAFNSADGPWPGLYRVLVAVTRAPTGKQLESSGDGDGGRSGWQLIVHVPDQASFQRNFTLTTTDPEIVEVQ